MGVNVRVFPAAAVPKPEPGAFFGEVRMVSGPLLDALRRADERGTGALYDSDFCGSISFADWWYHYARQLDLPLVRAIDDPGLVASGSVLDQLKAELDRLEACWAGLDFSRRSPKGRTVIQADGSRRDEEIPFRDYLWGGLTVIREAIEVARAHGGILIAG